VLREAGRRIPDDVALVGFDDSAVARHMDPALTSVRQPIEEMGRTMAEVLLLGNRGAHGRAAADRAPDGAGRTRVVLAGSAGPQIRWSIDLWLRGKGAEMNQGPGPKTGIIQGE
jgi:hypothetical protein